VAGKMDKYACSMICGQVEGRRLVRVTELRELDCDGIWQESRQQNLDDELGIGRTWGFVGTES